MSYSHILVAVAATPESQQLLDKAVSIARPVNARISLITLVSDPELYNQFAAPMLEDLREVMQEETQDFIDKLSKEAEYPIEHTFITYGALNEHIWMYAANTPLIWSFTATITTVFSRASCSAKSVIHTSQWTFFWFR